MRFLKPEEVDFSKFSEQPELTPAEKEEVMRLYMAELDPSDLQEYANWASATPMEEFLQELEDEQRKWDAQLRGLYADCG